MKTQDPYDFDVNDIIEYRTEDCIEYHKIRKATPSSIVTVNHKGHGYDFFYDETLWHFSEKRMRVIRDPKELKVINLLYFK